MSYQTALLGWHDFYSISGMAAASLVGLLFVGLSLHIRFVVKRPDVQALARVTLTNFIVTLILALLMVIPETNPTVTGWELIGLSVIPFLFIVPGVVPGLRSAERMLSFRRLLLRFGLSALGFLGVAASGAMLAAGDYQRGLGQLVSVVVVVLVVSLRNSWDLLVTIADAALSEQSESGAG